jgi:putative sterol carrier protein
MGSQAAVPTDPGAFFERYLPARLAELGQGRGAATSPGAVVFHVSPGPPLALRLTRGALQVQPGVPEDTLLQVFVKEDDFVPIVVRAAESWEESSIDPTQEPAAWRALSLDAEHAALLRDLAGSVAFLLADEGAERRLLVAPGSGSTDPAVATCTVRCTLSDFQAMQRGAENPFELLMNGKIQITGDAQLVMALSGAFL